MASTMSPSSSASAMVSPDPMQQDLSWLSRLSSQPVFSSSSPSTSTPRGKTNMITRGSDLILLIDGQLRMMSLSSIKNATSNASDSSLPSLSSYKTLANDVLSEALSSKSHRVELVLNPSQTLLAISQLTSLIIVILPRTSALSSSSPTIAVKAHKVGSFYHNSHSPRSEHLTCTRWHPWSKRATSLLVLLRNGDLYEYDVARDLAEPQQTVRLLPLNTRHASPKIGIGGRSHTGAYLGEEEDEEDELQAVSFTLGLGEIPWASKGEGQGSVDWTPLTIYVLTGNGDVWAAAPFLPRHCLLPSSYLHSLSAYVQQSTDASGRQRDYALRFVSNLLKQARLYQESKTAHHIEQRETSRLSRATTPAEVLAREAMGSRRSEIRKSASAMSVSLDPDSTGNVEESPDLEEGMLDFVEVTAPQMPIVPGSIMPQGPFLLAPAPHELNESRENHGSDISFLRLPTVSSTSHNPESSVDLELLLLLGDDGRIDVGVLNVAGKVGPRWAPSQEKNLGFASRLNKTIRKERSQASRSGRYALSDSSDDDIEEASDTLDCDEGDLNQDPGELPVLFIYETLDLGFPNQRPSLHPQPRLIKDPVYQDTLYVHHAFGAHMLCLSSWSNTLARLLQDADEEELRRFLHVSKESEVRWIVKIQDSQSEESKVVSRDGVTAVRVVDDIYLGYSLLVLLGDGDCFGLELSLRATTQAPDSQSASLQRAIPPEILGSEQQGKKYYTSLLGSEPFEPPEPFSHSSSTTFPIARLKTSTPAVAHGELKVTPETLRLLGTSVQDLRGKMREVVGGGNVIQRRLELQIKELHRQAGKLADIEKRISSFSSPKQGQQDPDSILNLKGAAGARGDDMGSRIERVTLRQKKLIQRVDRVLQASMDSADMGISKYEEVWLKEMQEMQKEIGRSEDEGLRGRVDKLQCQLSQLKPDLQTHITPSTHSHQLSSPASSTLGSKQLQRILVVLGEESTRLLEAREKVQRLNRIVARQSSGGGGMGALR